MGLDITAYRGLKVVECLFSEDNEPVDEHGKWRSDVTTFYINPHFPGRADDIKGRPNDNVGYDYDDAHKFRAGSYGGYSYFREQLAVFMGWGCAKNAYDGTHGPMWEMICFSDCEGTLGTSVCKKLHKEFVENAERAEQHEDEWFRELYKEWMTAFEYGADYGAVEFH